MDESYLRMQAEIKRVAQERGCSAQEAYFYILQEVVAENKREADRAKEIIAARSPVFTPEIKLSDRECRHGAFGLTGKTLQNRMYSAIKDLEGLSVTTPADLNQCPVMLFLEVLMKEAQAGGGKIKLTPKGNLSKRVVERCNDAGTRYHEGLGESAGCGRGTFFGSGEDHFRALQYTRELLQTADMAEVKGGHLCVSQEILIRFESEGVRAFYTDLLETALRKYSWACGDECRITPDLQLLWAPMMYERLSGSDWDEVAAQILHELPDFSDEMTSELRFRETLTQDDLIRQIEHAISHRFNAGFLRLWGFTVDRRTENPDGTQCWCNELTPLFYETFSFEPEAK